MPTQSWWAHLKLPRCTWTWLMSSKPRTQLLQHFHRGSNVMLCHQRNLRGMSKGYFCSIFKTFSLLVEQYLFFCCFLVPSHSHHSFLSSNILLLFSLCEFYTAAFANSHSNESEEEEVSSGLQHLWVVWLILILQCSVWSQFFLWVPIPSIFFWEPFQAHQIQLPLPLPLCSSAVLVL